jgi:uncharacterized protein (DUF2141 family)
VLRFVLAAMLLTAGVARAADLAVLTVRIENVSTKGGDLRLGLYDEKSFGDDNGEPAAGKVVNAHPGETVVTLDGVPPGAYAIKTFLDQNRNGKFDMSWYGLPKEKYGFSNDAGPDWMHLAPPTFESAKIVLKPGPNTTTINLH